MEDDMGIAGLAEAVILQAICDLFNRSHRKDGVRFLTGQGFRIASDIARISHDDRSEILNMFSKVCDGKVIE